MHEDAVLGYSATFVVCASGNLLFVDEVLVLILQLFFVGRHFWSFRGEVEWQWFLGRDLRRKVRGLVDLSFGGGGR